MILIVCRLIVYAILPLITTVFPFSAMVTGNDIRKKFGDRVRELRLAKGWSQEELAFQTEMHRTYLSGIERGERNPALKNIAKIAEALEVSLSELFLYRD